MPIKSVFDVSRQPELKTVNQTLLNAAALAAENAVDQTINEN